METPSATAGAASATPAPIGAAPDAKRRFRLAGTIVTWLALAVLTIVVLGLLALSLGPKILPYQALVVRSGSMSPTIPTGSVVFYKKVTAAKVKVGDVIVFDKPGQQNEKVTHRVFKISNSTTGKYFTATDNGNTTASGSTLVSFAAHTGSDTPPTGCVVPGFVKA